jgi:chemotaxis protein CheX
MKVEYINPFVASIKSVFATMLDCQIDRGEPFIKEGSQPHHEVNGIIGLSGKAKGTVVLSLERDTALAVTEAMLQERPSEIDADVVDAVGELTNVIAGGAKAKLEQFALSVSLPTVIVGKTHCLEFPSNVTPISIPFHCRWGEVTLEVGLIEQPAEVSAVASS